MTNYNDHFVISEENFNRLNQEDFNVLNMAILNLNVYKSKFPNQVKSIIYTSDTRVRDCKFSFISTDKNDDCTVYICWLLSFCSSWLIAIRYGLEDRYFLRFQKIVQNRRSEIENKIMYKFSSENVNNDKSLFYKKFRNFIPLGFLNEQVENEIFTFCNSECDLVESYIC
jgi:hypothetical protein